MQNMYCKRAPLIHFHIFQQKSFLRLKKETIGMIVQPQLKLIEEMHHIQNILLFIIYCNTVILTKPRLLLSVVYPIDHNVFECR